MNLISNAYKQYFQKAPYLVADEEATRHCGRAVPEDGRGRGGRVLRGECATLHPP